MQSRIKETTRKMMAIVSELSMNQANAMRLQQALKGQESVLEQCYLRMEKGEPPSDEIYRDWLRLCRDEERKSYERAEQRAVRLVSGLYIYIYIDYICVFWLIYIYIDYISILYVSSGLYIYRLYIYSICVFWLTYIYIYIYRDYISILYVFWLTYIYISI